MALFRSDAFCAILIANGTGGTGDNVELAGDNVEVTKDSKDAISAGPIFVGPIAEDFASAPPTDTTSTPRHHPTIDLFGSIFVLAGETSRYGKKSDRADARVSRHVSLQALDNLTRCAPTIRLLKDFFEIDHALL
jgi:hypothetical protein